MADPADDARLPGAEREGQEVADLFEMFNRFALPGGARVQVTRLFGPFSATRRRVLLELVRGCDVLHFCGHAFYDPNNPQASGLLFHAGADGKPCEVLTGLELRTLDRVPQFVFLNACESGVTSNRPEDRTVAAAPSFAEAFFEQGVRGFVCTGWPVGDAAARLFARPFYARMLGLAVNPDGDLPRVSGVPTPPATAAEALRTARLGTVALPAGLRTWGRTSTPAARSPASSRGTSPACTAGSRRRPPRRAAATPPRYPARRRPRPRAKRLPKPPPRTPSRSSGK